MLGRSHAGRVRRSRRYVRKLPVTWAKWASWPSRNESGIVMWISAPRSLADAGIAWLQRLEPGPNRREDLRLHRGRGWHHVQFRAKAIGARLSHLDAGPRAAIEGEMRVAGSGLGLPVPDHVQLRVDPAQGVRDERVAEVLEPALLDRGGDALRKSRLVRDAPEILYRDPGRPPLGRQDVNIGVIVNRPAGKEGPLRQVHEVRADVVESVALLGRVEEPGWSDVGSAGDDLLQVMHAFHVDRGFLRSPSHDFPERCRIVDELALETVRRLETLRHDVKRDDSSGIGLGQCRLQHRQIVRRQDPGLVSEHVKAGPHRREDPGDLPAIASGEDDDVARALAEHALEEVRARVDFHRPHRRLLGACVEGDDAVEVFRQVGPEGGIDVDALRHARVHFFLYERRVEMAGVDRHETYVRHRAFALLHADRESAEKGGHERRAQSGAHHEPIDPHSAFALRLNWSSWKPWSAGNGEYGENGITQRNRGTETRRETKRFLRDVSVALLLCVCRFLCTLRFRLRTLRLRGAIPVRGVLHVADALVIRILRIRAERARHGRRRVRGGQLGWGYAFLTPVFHRADRVEGVRAGAAAAMRHAGDHEEAHPGVLALTHFLEDALVEI